MNIFKFTFIICIGGIVINLLFNNLDTSIYFGIFAILSLIFAKLFPNLKENIKYN